MDAVSNVPPPLNEPVRAYAPGSAERAAVEAKIKELAASPVELTMAVGGQQRMGGGDRIAVVEPHNHAHVLGHLGNATDADVSAAIEAAAAAAPAWRARSFDDRAGVFLKAAELLAGPWRATINAATMLGQSKSVYQAEIDAACELIDFWRYNAHFARRLLAEQPSSVTGEWDRMEYRPLEGFVLAITPFNFTSIAANLPTAPALLGNTVLWKPSPTQQFSAHFTMRLLEAAGLPPGVINLVTGDGQAVSRVALAAPGPGRHPLHRVHGHVPAPVAHRGGEHRPVPRLPAAGRRDRRQGLRDRASVGRPGRAHRGADPGRVRVPGPEVLGRIPRLHPPVGVGPDARQLPGPGGRAGRGRRRVRPVPVHGRGHRRTRVPEAVRRAGPGPVPAVDPGAGRRGRGRLPGILRPADGAGVQRPRRTRCSPTEYFGPILAVHVFDDARYDEVVAQAADVAPYALTGAIIAQDRDAIAAATEALRFAAGNFYINDKPTGAVVGRQPFGGARASGTNDKAGSIFNLTRWVNARAIKELFAPPTDYRYPHMG